MVQNLARAVGHILIALLLGAGTLADFGIVLPAWRGGLPMSASTIPIAIYAQTLLVVPL